MSRSRVILGLALIGGLIAAAPRAEAAGTAVKVTGEIIDTWCYMSGVMGGPDATVGTAHHTCATWCAAAGIPVGLLSDDGTLYMVLKLPGIAVGDGNDSLLSIQSHKVTAQGMVYQRDGLNYLLVEKVESDAGIVRKSHEDFGVIPAFAIPDAVIEKAKKQ